MTLFTRLGLVLVCGLVLSIVGRTQSPVPPPRDLLKSARPLNSQDVTRILQASHAAMAGKTFRVSYLPNAGTPSMRIELQMDPGGRPRYLRSLNSWSTSFTEYTGRRARSCDGALLTDELVLAYTVVSDKSMFLPDVFKGWIDDGKGERMRTDARARSSHELLADVFDMFTGDSEIVVGATSRVDGHSVRALLAPVRLRPGDYSHDPIPPEIQQSLWLDVESLLLIRWEITRSGVSMDYGYVFTFDPTLEMRPPDGLAPPDCIP